MGRGTPTIVTMLRRPTIATLVALLVLAGERAALACPTCQSGTRNLEFLKLGALLSLVPFAVVAMVLWVLRQAPREDER
jgi:hypothetical protein